MGSISIDMQQTRIYLAAHSREIILFARLQNGFIER